MRWHAHAGPLSYYSGPWRHREPMRGGWILETDVVSLQPPVLSWAILLISSLIEILVGLAVTSLGAFA